MKDVYKNIWKWVILMKTLMFHEKKSSLWKCFLHNLYLPYKNIRKHKVKINGEGNNRSRGRNWVTFVPCFCGLVAKPCPNLLRPYGLWPDRLLYPWNPPGKNTGAGSHSLLQGISLAQKQNQDLLYSGRFFFTFSHKGRPQ